MRRIALLAGLFLSFVPFVAQGQVMTSGGGTGTTSPSGILYGDGTLHLKTVGIGSNLTFTGGVLSASGGGGTFPFTPTANYNSTSTPIGFLQGLFSTASSTFNGNVFFPNLSQGLAFIGTNGIHSTVGTSTLTASSPLTGSFTQVGSGGALGCQTASGSQAGCLSSADWNTFNGKSSFAYPFSLNGYATSSVLAIFASTTIGNGNQNGGLTISGGATTTGNAYFAGNVGIGTTTPTAKLVVGTGAMPGFSTTVFVTDPTAAYMDFKSAGNPELIFGSDGNTNGFFGTFSNNDLGIRTNNALRVLVDKLGRVGIGTSTPGTAIPSTNETLDVYGNGIVTNDASSRSMVFGNYSGNSGIIGTFSSNNLVLRTANSDRVTIDTSGLVGIGTSSPVEKLSILSADNMQSTNIFAVRANNLTQGVALGWNNIREIGTNGNNNFLVDAQGTGSLLLQTVSSGNVGIGTSTPGSLLSIGGTGVGINFTLATTTHNTTGGIDLEGGGCFSIKTVCVGGGGGGTVTNVATNSTLTGGPITTTGTLGINLSNSNIWSGLQQFNGQASSTQQSVYGELYVGDTATSTLFGSATSTFPYGVNIATTNGCVAFNGTCLNSSISNATAWKQAVNYATTGALPSNTYNNGTSGVGATITEVGTGALSIDGASPSVGQRVLIKNEGTAANNGIYTVTVAGSGIAAFVLTRATDFNSTADVYPGVAAYVISGTANGDDSFVLTSAAPITIGTTALTFAIFANGNITLPITIANGGTNATSFSTSGNAVYYNGTSLVTAPTTGSITIPYATTTAISATATSTFSAGVGIGTTTPAAPLDVNGAAFSECVPVADASTITLNWYAGNCFTVTVAASRTLAFSNVYPGETIRVFVTQGGSGSNTLTYPGSVSWPAKTAPTLTTAVGTWDVISFTTATSTATVSGATSIGY